jgi:hypothetical protein
VAALEIGDLSVIKALFPSVVFDASMIALVRAALVSRDEHPNVATYLPWYPDPPIGNWRTTR